MAAAAALSAWLAACAAPAQSESGTFPAFLWPEDPAARPAPVLVAAIGGVKLARSQEPAWLGATPFFIAQAAGRGVLHPEREEFEPQWHHAERLVGLTSPTWRDSWLAELEAALAGRTTGFGFGIALGDEPSLTPWGDPLDQRGLELPTTERALAVRSLPADWLARRRTEREGFTSTLVWMASAARRAAEGAPIGLLGLADESAFRGLDLARLFEAYDFVETYPGGLATELLWTERAMRPDVVRSSLWRTVFTAYAEPADLRQQVARHWLEGADACVVWSERGLAARPDRAAALRDALERVRAWSIEHRDLEPSPMGVAFVRDFDAQCGAWWREARGERGTWRARQAGWQRQHGARERLEEGLRLALCDLGQQPGVLTADRLGEQASERFPVWIAVELDPVSDDLRRALARHLADGGTVWSVGALGARLTGALVELDPDLASYAALRRAPTAARAVRLRAELRGELRRAGVAEPPVRVGVDGTGPPWLLRWVQDSSGLVGAAVPHREVSGESRRAPLAPARVRVVPRSTGPIRWWTGEPDPSAPDDPFRRVLPAGEPALFRIESGAGSG